MIETEPKEQLTSPEATESDYARAIEMLSNPENGSYLETLKKFKPFVETKFAQAR